MNTEIHTDAGGFTRPVSYMGRGMRSIYMLSLLEADLDDSNYPCIIMMEEPEMSLHPTLQKSQGIFFIVFPKTPGYFYNTFA